jgi:ubiquinone/menaquinone biosynthesis C-methylase UbiE
MNAALPRWPISQEDGAAIQSQCGLEPQATLDYFHRLFIEPLNALHPLAGASLLDCACGKGWVAVLAAHFGATVTGVDLSPGELAHAQRLAEAMGVGERVTFLEGDVTRLPFGDRAFDVVVSLETIEHVPHGPALNELVRVCDGTFVIETINQAFPVDTHDTPWPMVHWLPHPLRARVNRLRGNHEVSHYPTVVEVEQHLRDFDLKTPFKTFNDPEAWSRVFPLHHPYQGGARIDLKSRKWRLKKAYYQLAFSLLGKRSRFAMDKIQGIYQRRQGS